MSQLTDFINANRLDHDETFCVSRAECRLIAIRLMTLCPGNPIPIEVAYWDESLPDETKARFGRNAGSGHVLLTCPFTKRTLRQFLSMDLTKEDAQRIANQYSRADDVPAEVTAVLQQKDAEAQPRWRFEKFREDMAIYAICPECGFSHSPSRFDFKTGEHEITGQYRYCPMCGTYLYDCSEDIDVVWNERSITDRHTKPDEQTES